MKQHLIGLILAVTLATAPAQAQDSLRAAVIVNDEMISQLDVAQRVQLALLATRLPESPENRARLQQQVVRSLIDERLQMQEAKRLGIEVDEAEIEAAWQGLATQNNMSIPQFKDALRQNGVLASSLEDQIRASLAWQQVVARRLRPNIEVSEVQVEEVQKRLRQSQGQRQVRLAEILLPVDTALDAPEIKRNADRLLEELAKGAEFGALARQFSQSATAVIGGDRDWISVNQLPEELAAAVADRPTGSLVGPVETASGYYIVLIREDREALSQEIDKEAIRRNLERQQLELQARRYLRDLRRDANVDLRI